MKDVKKKEGNFEQQIAKLSDKEVREMLFLTLYKLEMTRMQVDALTDILVQKKVLKRENLWKLTSKKFEEHGF